MSTRVKMFEDMWRVLTDARHVLVASHNDPDGDAVAGVLAVYLMLAGTGVRATPYLPDTAPATFGYLPGFERITRNEPRDADWVVALDYADWRRLALSDTWNDTRVVTIDHHPARNQRGRFKLIDEAASSTCELLYEWCAALKLPIGRDLAITLLSGIISDTGGFQHANTSPRTLEVVEDLMLKGAPLPSTLKRLTLNRSPALLRAWGTMLRRVAIDEATGSVYVLVGYDELVADHINPEDLSGFSSLLSTIPDSRCAAFIMEAEPGVVRGSLRSEGPGALNVAAVAQSLGGGGHERAAGFTLTQTNVAKAWRLVRQALTAQLKAAKIEQPARGRRVSVKTA